MTLRSGNDDSVKAATEDDAAPLLVAGVTIPDPARSGIVLSGRNLSEVSLAPIATQVDPLLVRQISLASNALAAVDLAPLSVAMNLESLMLNGNALSSIDLSPLASCTSLSKLWLHDNKITDVDLAPLASCITLKSLYLERNQLAGPLDLGSLAKCRLLRSLRLGGNPYNGELDVTPLLSCASLSILDVPFSAKLVAVVQRADAPSNSSTTPNGASPLPPALRKRSATLNWTKARPPAPSSPTSITQDKSPEKPVIPIAEMACNALLIGFPRRAQIALETLLSSKKFTTANVALGSQLENLVAGGSAALARYHVLLLSPSAETHIRALRNADSSLPMAVVANEASCADAASRCLRRGATCFFTEPLDSRAALALRDLAEKRVEERRKRAAAAAEAMAQFSEPPHLIRSRSCPAALLLAHDRSINFEKIRQRHMGNVPGSNFMRSRFEESSLAVAFTRLGGIVNDNEFASVTSLCGLPKCASILLFEAAVTYAGPHRTAQKEPGVFGLDYDSFSEFYTDRMKSVDPDARLFNLLTQGKSKVVKQTALVQLLDDFCTPTRLAGLCDRGEASQKHRRMLLTVMAAVLTFAVSGRSAGISLYQMRKHRLTSSLLAAETGVFDGVMQSLRPDKIDKVISDFCEAADSDNILRSLSHDEFVRHCEVKGSLTPLAASALVSKYGRRAIGLDIVEFARFHCCCSDLSGNASIDYVFHLADQDSDGFLGMEDVAHWYKEKQVLLAQRGLSTISFPVVWRWLQELLQVPRESATERSVLRPQHLYAAPKPDVESLLKSLMFLDDDLGLADPCGEGLGPLLNVPTPSPWKSQ